MNQVINTLAELAARQKLVPFMGAGCSSQMLPDWDGIVGKMANELEQPNNGDNLKVAEEFVERFGKNKFCDFLKENLTISDFEDDKGYVHLTIMNMGVPAIYTTNQDNVMEKAYDKYGKKFRTIINVEDFSEIKLSEQLYIKYHGDLNYPDSIVFTESDYTKRINDNNNFLNIRLKADLLSKSLLFVGYSFRDINIQKLFKELNETFEGKLPLSYMIAFKYTPELEALCKEYGIILIDPMKEFPDFQNHIEAFNMFLQKLMEGARVNKLDIDIQELFHPSHTHIIKVVNQQEIEMLSKVAIEESFERGIKLFRQVCDLSDIPIDFESNIVEIYEVLSQKANGNEETEQLNAAIFNLRLKSLLPRLDILTSLMFSSNTRTGGSTFRDEMFFIHIHGVDLAYYSIVAARAIEKLYELGNKPSKSFVYNIGNWIERSIDFTSLPKNMKIYLRCFVDKMRKDCRTVFEDPINRQQRLAELSFQKPKKINEEQISNLEEFLSSSPRYISIKFKK